MTSKNPEVLRAVVSLQSEPLEGREQLLQPPERLPVLADVQKLTDKQVVDAIALCDRQSQAMWKASVRWGIACGAFLHWRRHSMAHGEWAGWVKTNLGEPKIMSGRTERGYRRLYQFLGELPVDQLPPSLAAGEEKIKRMLGSKVDGIRAGEDEPPAKKGKDTGEGKEEPRPSEPPPGGVEAVVRGGQAVDPGADEREAGGDEATDQEMYALEQGVAAFFKGKRGWGFRMSGPAPEVPLAHAGDLYVVDPGKTLGEVLAAVRIEPGKPIIILPR